MRRKKKVKSHKSHNIEIWTEEQYEEYLAELYGMEYIAGFTEGGVPYGIFREDIETYKVSTLDSNSGDDEIPF